MAESKGAVVTEYAWEAGRCDPCPVPALDAADVATLGGDVALTTPPSGTPGQVTLGALTSTPGLPAEIIQRVLRQNHGRFRLCQEKSTSTARRADVTVAFTIDAKGAASKVSVEQAAPEDVGLDACLHDAFLGLSFPAPEKAPVSVEMPVASEACWGWRSRWRR